MRLLFKGLGLLILLLLLMWAGWSMPRRSSIIPAPSIANAAATNAALSSATSQDTQLLKSMRRSFHVDLKISGTPGTSDQLIELEGHRIFTTSEPKVTFRNNRQKPEPYFVQFTGPIRAEWKERLENVGGKIHGYIPNNAYAVDLTPSMVKRLAHDSFVQWIHPIDTEHKIQPFLGKLIDTKDKTVPEIIPVTINTYTPEDAATIAGALRGMSIIPLAESEGKRWGSIRAEVPRNQITTIAALDRVQWIEEYVAPELFNDQAVNGRHMNVTNVWFARGLTGAGQIIGHADTGLDLGSFSNMNPDFTGRVVVAFPLGRLLPWNDPNGHGTHTAGSLFGNGTMSTGLFRGVAWEAKIVHQSLLDTSGGLGGIPNDLNDLYFQTYTNGARVHSDSWGSSTFGSYTANSRESDEFMWDHPDMLLVFAAGNDGYDSGDGVVDPDSMGSPATAKNMLTVGAAESDRPPGSGGFSSSTYGSKWPIDYPSAPINGDFISQSASLTNQGISAFSSRGPTDDGRIKPDVVAPGNDVVSVRSRASGASSGWGVNANTNYNFNGGTSMATPLVAGAAALVRQYFQLYRDQVNPSAALIKGVMLHGARSLSPGQYGTGPAREIPAVVPNPVEGWGQVDVEGSLFPASAAWFFVDETNGLAAPGNFKDLVFYAGTGTVKVTLNYTDFPATAGGGKKLVNDLDISLRGPGGIGITNIFDRTNTSERISYFAATPGVYTARVSAINVPSGPQPYALIIGGPVVDQPVITHSPLGNVFQTNVPYAVTTRVTSATTLASDAVSLYWRDAGGTSEFTKVTMSRITNDVYEGFIPAHGNPSMIQYYITASSVVFSAASPTDAPTNVHSFLVTGSFNLTVSGNPSPIFSVSPDYGVHAIASGNVLRLSAPAYSNISPGLRIAATGWNGAGNVPASGNSNMVDVLIRQDSSIIWQWETQYSLTMTTFPAGVTVITWWSNWASASTVTADAEVVAAGLNFGFAGWTVDGLRQPNNTSVADNPATNISMYGPRTATAVFMQTTVDGNTNGLPDWWERFYFGTNSASPSTDSDSDGFSNVKEYRDRTNPRNASSFPTPPVITHAPLTDPQTSSAPWKIEAIISDNYAVSNAAVIRRINGGAWVTSSLSSSGITNFSGAISGPGTNSDVIVYRIEATDFAGLTATGGPYSFTIKYPLMSAAPTNFGEIGLRAFTSTNLAIAITNRGADTLFWKLDRALSFDHIENGTGTWTHAGQNDMWNINTGRFFSARRAWHFGTGPSGTYADSAHAWLIMAPFRIDAASKLVFKHWAKMEYDSDQNDDHYWDGAVVEISTNGGASYEMLTPEGGYPHRITDNTASPFPPETPCYGATDGWKPAEFDLSAYTGATVQIRFRFGSDEFVTEEGWYIDDVGIQYHDESMWTWLTIETNGIVGAQQTSNTIVTLDSSALDFGEHRQAVLVLTGNDPELDRPILIPIAINNISREIFVTFTANGTVSPSGSVLVNAGSSTSIWMAADTFYEVGQIETNGMPLAGFVPTDTTNFILTTVVSNQTIHIVFTEKLAAGLVPEWWLYVNGLTNSTPSQEAVTDHDGDGMLSWQEYWEKTEPTNAASVAMIVRSVTASAGNSLVEWLSFTNPAMHYEVHLATNLFEGFQPVATNVPATPPVNVFTNTGSATKFEIYRVRAVP